MPRFMTLCFCTCSIVKIYCFDVSCILICVAQERAIVGLFCIGLYTIFILHYRKFGILLCILSTVFFISATQFLLPFLRKISECAGTAYVFQDAIAPFAALDRKCIFSWQILAFNLFLHFCWEKGISLLSLRFPHVFDMSCL